MDYIRWILAVLFISFFGFMFFVNWRIAFCNYVKRTSFTSVIPFIGGIAGSLGLLIFPVKQVNSFWWIPLITEWGSIPLIIFTLLCSIFAKNKSSDTTNQ